MLDNIPVHIPVYSVCSPFCLRQGFPDLQCVRISLVHEYLQVVPVIDVRIQEARMLYWLSCSQTTHIMTVQMSAAFGVELPCLEYPYYLF
jgi:hypothetical protein